MPACELCKRVFANAGNVAMHRRRCYVAQSTPSQVAHGDSVVPQPQPSEMNAWQRRRLKLEQNRNVSRTDLVV